MKIDLCIATVGRVEAVRRLLNSLKQQSYTNFRVIVADQNPEELLRPVFNEFSSSLSMTILYVPNQGISHARNVLLAAVQGDIIAFPDDDCWYESGTLEAAATFFTQYPAYDGVLGRWVNSTREPQAATPRTLTKYTAFRNSETYVQFYRKAVIHTVGNFDVELGPGNGLPWGCGEDTDYVLRAIGNGFTIGRTNTIRVGHPKPIISPTPTAAHAQKYQAYALGRMYLLKKHTFPLWFKIINVLYPLLSLPRDVYLYGGPAINYRLSMFKGRFRGLFI